MVKLIIGEKGAGKTKLMLDDVKKAVAEGKGATVFINSGQRHMYDLAHQVRLIDSSEYELSDFSVFYGLICGIASQNYDITHIYVDSITKIVKQPLDEKGLVDLEKCMNLCGKLSDQYKFDLLVTLSISPDNCPEGLKRFC